MHRSKRTRLFFYPLMSFFLLAAPILRAQTTTEPAAAAPAQTTPAPATATATQTPGSAAARVRARRQQRIQAIVNDIYSHKYEAYAGGNYLRFRAGDSLQRVTEVGWNVGATDYIRPHLGITVDGRGYYGTAYTYNNEFQVFKPSISQYSLMAGAQYRVREKQHYAVGLCLLAGIDHGNFDTNTGGLTGTLIGLYPNGNAFALNGGIPTDINISPALAVRITPEFLYTTFGSSNQFNLGFTAGILYRFGKKPQ
jgi:hypothetical protein